MKFDPEAHHRRSVRLKNYDYSQPGAYFVTITTHQRTLLFGKITGETMSLNQYGKIVQSCWEQIPRHFMRVQPVAFIVMPNHVHGIIIILDLHAVGAQHAVPLRHGPQTRIEAFAQPVPGSLPTIIRSFKSAATKRINLLRDTPAAPVWQRNYYEHVIRSDAELNQIKEYVKSNSAKWALDHENPDNCGQLDLQPISC